MILETGAALFLKGFLTKIAVAVAKGNAIEPVVQVYEIYSNKEIDGMKVKRSDITCEVTEIEGYKLKGGPWSREIKELPYGCPPEVCAGILAIEEDEAEQRRRNNRVCNGV